MTIFLPISFPTTRQLDQGIPMMNANGMKMYEQRNYNKDTLKIYINNVTMFATLLLKNVIVTKLRQKNYIAYKLVPVFLVSIYLAMVEKYLDHMNHFIFSNTTFF